MKERFKKHLLTHETGKTEWIVFAVWLILVCVIRHFHEPWFDESQAWQIARFASVKELLLEVEHYEGHPPLWHLILMPFAKAELPYQLTIFIINTVFNGAALFLLLFCSPMPRWLRCYLPFNYFIFYMHGVHTRPYSMMMLAMFLAAMTYKERDEKPGRYVLSLIFLCFTTVYGVMFACGLCLVWTWGILSEYRIKKHFAGLRDRRVWWLSLILIVGVSIYLCTSPAEDITYGGGDMTFTKGLKRLYYLSLILFDCTFGAFSQADESVEIEGARVLSSVIGLVMWAVLIPLLKKNGKLLTCLVPYLIGSLFCTFYYFNVHHLEIFQLLFIFVLWIMFDKGIELPELYGAVRAKLDSRLTILLLKGAALVVLCAPIVYSGVSSYLEIRYRYGPAEMVEFIKEHHLEERKILVIWDITQESGEKKEGLDAIIRDETLPPKNYPNIESQRTTLTGDPSTVYAHFDRDANFFSYFNVGESQRKWMIWRDQSPGEVQQTFEEWQKIGLPDFIFGSLPIQEAFPEEMLDGVTYYWVDDVHRGTIWKMNYTEGVDHVYIRGDLLDEYPEFEVKTYATILTEPIK